MDLNICLIKHKLTFDVVGEEKVFLDSLRVPGSVEKLTKTDEQDKKHTNLFNTNFTWYRSLHKEMKSPPQKK